ncbi:hypothetical protein Acor_33910 [Acrocarpospora corrugata]|uniref:Methane oxygenase PmoA n=1 Tax=Acrocarpospora corrugata TaxID=35763 RepID=A0A5M3VWU9_9ACTN|nr:PmoA family protein [Acrocarpospora corrugata]GES01327.1 hypothetical protein Acor_33910 [Acrocarpospora corrugata]
MPDVIIETGADRVSVFRTGSSTPVLVQNAAADRRPYIHPIVVPGGTAAVTEDAPAHHPWQHGLYVGLNDVNGIGFWMEGLRPERADQDGTFHPRLLGAPRVEGNLATWGVSTEYRYPSGELLLRETQEWEFADHGDWYDLDLTLTFHADEPVTFGQYAYGGLFLRMPYRAEAGGTAFNSAGQSGPEAEGQRATWAAARMPVPGHEGDVLVVVMDHPSNAEHPVPWRVDNELGIGPSVCVAGAWRIGAGEARSFRHRVAVYGEPVATPVIEENWTSFSKRGSA